MTIAESGSGMSATRSLGRQRLPRDVAVDPLHRIGGRERQRSREHLVEGDAERVEIAAGIDRAVHPPGLFRRHVGERPGDHLRRLGGLALARQTRGDAEAGQPDAVPVVIHQDVGRLDVLMDEPARVHADGAQPRARSRCAGNRDTSIGWPSS